MFCGKCGTEIKGGDSFCTNCGTKIENVIVVNKFKNAKLGDIVTFGEYYKDDTSGNVKEPIEWLVLNIELDAKYNYNKILLLSKNIIDYKRFNFSDYTNYLWEQCELRIWLNNEFCLKAFGSNSNRICETKVPAHKNMKYEGTIKENETIDRVFLLSTEEINQYLDTDERRKAVATKYTKVQSKLVSLCDSYWLRTIGSESRGAAIVREDGHIKYSGLNAESTCGIRPAIWVKI